MEMIWYKKWRCRLYLIPIRTTLANQSYKLQFRKHFSFHWLQDFRYPSKHSLLIKTNLKRIRQWQAWHTWYLIHSTIEQRYSKLYTTTNCQHHMVTCMILINNMFWSLMISRKYVLSRNLWLVVVSPKTNLTRWSFSETSEMHGQQTRDKHDIMEE